MSLVTVHTIQVDGQDNRGLVALNTEKISVLSEVDGKAHFQFSPFEGRIHEYLVAESESHILNAPVQYDSSTITFTTVGGSLTVTGPNVLRVYPHDSKDRTYMVVLSGTTIDVHVIKGTMLEVVWEVNKIQ